MGFFIQVSGVYFFLQKSVVEGVGPKILTRGTLKTMWCARLYRSMRLVCYRSTSQSGYKTSTRLGTARQYRKM